MTGPTISLQELAELRATERTTDQADAIIDAIDDQWSALQDARASGIDIGTICRIAIPVIDLLRALCSLAPSSINANVQNAGNGCGPRCRCNDSY